jgi:hypothetical protein
MWRIVAIMVLAGALSGCAQMPQWSWSRGFANLEVSPRAQAFSFDWQLSGDPGIAPLQVFDDGRRTWLQFAAGQPPPALFRRAESGDILLRASHDGLYLIVDGVWPHLLVRGGHLLAHVRRTPPEISPSSLPDAAPHVLPVVSSGVSSVVSPVVAPDSGPDSGPDSALDSAPGAPAMPLALSGLKIEPMAETSPPVTEPAHPGNPLANASAPEVGGDTILPAASTPEFRAGPEDGNVRLALVRWSQAAGWTFAPEHWAVEVDIPLTGTATFEPPFKSAVRQLMAATELGDRPLQPCFYTNRVLRIVPFAQRCDRTLAPGAA